MINHSICRNKRNEILNSFKSSNKISIILNVHILDEGIDIPECDSIFITNESNNMSNMIQRICRCNRKKDKISDVYLWDNEKKINKIIKYLDDNSDNEFSKKIVKKYKYNKEVVKDNLNLLLLNNIEYNKIDKKVVRVDNIINNNNKIDDKINNNKIDDKIDEIDNNKIDDKINNNKIDDKIDNNM